jgi:hypothetical protein
MNEDIAVIILNWKGTKDTIECVRSLERIKSVKYKIFIVDNESNGSSIKAFREIKNKKIKLVPHIQNLGFAEGSNSGVKEATQEGFNYFLLLNNDTVVSKNLLKELINCLSNSKKVGVVSPLVFDYYNKKRLSKKDSPGRFNLKTGGGSPWKKDLQSLALEKDSFRVDYSSGSCWLIKREVLEKSGLFNKKFLAYAEEIDTALRINKSGYTFLINPRAKIWHKVGASSKKYSGFKLYHSTRNMIWLERMHSSKIDFIYFLFNFFIIKVPKNVLLIFLQKERFFLIKRYILGLIHGFFKKKIEFSGDENYKI